LNSHRLWKRCAAECYADANWLELYLLQRGGRCCPGDIPAPKIQWPDDPVDPIQPVYEALQVEKTLTEDLIGVCKIAVQHYDAPTEDAIQARFLRKESKHIKDLGDLLQQVVRVSKTPGHGLYQLDRELRECKGKLPWGAANCPDHCDKLLAKAIVDLEKDCMCI
jgi:ferritin heavy chain